MSQQLKQQPRKVRHVREFRKHKIIAGLRMNRHFNMLPKHKRLVLILENAEQHNDPYSKLEMAAILWEARCDPRSGLPTCAVQELLTVLLNQLNKEGFPERYPFLKVYSIPDLDGTTTSSGTEIVRDHLKIIYGRRIPEIIARLKTVIDGLEASIARLTTLQSAGQRRVLREVEKYKQQLEYEAQAKRADRRSRQAGVQ